jgi:hypothetical protein
MRNKYVISVLINYTLLFPAVQSPKILFGAKQFVPVLFPSRVNYGLPKGLAISNGLL